MLEKSPHQAPPNYFFETTIFAAQKKHLGRKGHSFETAIFASGQIWIRFYLWYTQTNLVTILN